MQGYPQMSLALEVTQGRYGHQLLRLYVYFYHYACMTGINPRRIKYVQFVWPYLPKSVIALRNRGEEVLDDRPAWS